MRALLWFAVWLRRIVVLLIVVALLLGAPVAYTEAFCKGGPGRAQATALLPPEARRDESRTFTTYPEWHIVYAYDDYAAVIADGDPHEFGYLRAIGGFWSSLCPLARKAAEHGGFTAESKQTIYTIGASFTLEMALKGLYEETLGRIATLVRGEERAPLDGLSAEQAAAYADFLRQTPWYRWDFAADAGALWAANSGTPRDWERAVALTIENRGKSLYAAAIAQAVAATGQDELTMRSVVRGIPAETLSGIEGVTVIGPRGEGTEIETPRYRAFTEIARRIAAADGEFVEIAGNDDILFTVVTAEATFPNALHSFARQGRGDYRHLVEAKVWGLAGRLRELAERGTPVEHIHDY